MSRVGRRRASTAAVVLLLLATSSASGEDTKPPPLVDEPTEKPYIEGWRGGSNPGEHVTFRADLWFLSKQNTALELGHEGRMKAVTTGDLGHDPRGAAGGLGVELYTGQTGWVSLDWWAHQERAATTLERDISILETSFAQGSLVASEVTQHMVKVRDGLDIRYRIPIAPETWLDFNFGPVTSLLIRYESITVKTLSGTGGPRVSEALLTVTLCPGWRAGVDLHVLDGFTVRIGNDVDLLPHLPHNWLSFTRAPSVDAWADARVYLAARFRFVELSFGWRYFRSLASGSQFRQAATEMRGVFAELAARF